jgi:hypothetical protein
MTTAMKIRPIPTHRAAERSARRKATAEALQSSLIDKVATLRDSDEWTRFLDFARSFHSYSPHNVMMILTQCDHATQVTGYRKWQALGRQVRKGEKAIKISGYSTKKYTETNDAGEDVEKRRTTFPLLSVFDISQTDPIDGADPVPEIAHRLTGTDDEGIFAATAEWLTAAGWSIEVDNIAGETNGMTLLDGSHRIIIDADLTDAQAAKTILHEAAHAILHVDEAGERAADVAAHRGIRETEAESVAYVVAGLLGLDTSAYSVGYVAGWANADLDLIKDTATNVLRAVHIIADALDTDQDAE